MSKPCTPPDGTISDEEISAVDESLLDPSTTGFWSKWRALKSSVKPRLNTQGRIYKNCMVVVSKGPFKSSDPPPGTFWNWDLFGLGWGTDKYYYQISCKIDFLSSELPVPSWIRQAEIKSMEKTRSSLAPENLVLNSPMPYREQYLNDIAHAVYESISSFFLLVEGEDERPKPGDLIDVEISDEAVSLIRISQKGPSQSTESTGTFASTLSNFFGGSSSKMLGESYNGPPIETDFPEQFSLSKLIRQDKYPNNTPGTAEVENLKSLVKNLLDPIQKRLNEQGGGVITITSGFRNAAVNEAVKGDEASRHKLGQAADFAVPVGFNAKTFSEWIKEQEFEFDKMIWYDLNIGGHIHIQYVDGGNRNQWKHAYKKDGKTKYDSYDGAVKDIQENTDK